MLELKIGSSGAEVIGPRTEAAVRQFQSFAGISVDGTVGIKTWRALDHGVTTTSDVSPVPFHDAIWLKIAAAEVGQREFPGSPANPRIIMYHGATSLRATSDEVAWCSAFVNWCLKQAGIVVFSFITLKPPRCHQDRMRY
ncbi:peptidoglycan-binding protein [Geomonas sp. Red51]|nr:peptidoglycan-binding protein [Geomonas azotofigens]